VMTPTWQASRAPSWWTSTGSATRRPTPAWRSSAASPRTRSPSWPKVTSAICRRGRRPRIHRPATRRAP
jgi:hypothetical protein